MTSRLGGTWARRTVPLPELVARKAGRSVSVVIPALWRSLAATTGDLVVFVDGDLVDPDPEFVPALLTPLLTRPDIHLVKGCCRRPLHGTGDEGGRVTQLVARPLLTALVPDLADLMQPLGGEYAATRALLTTIPFAPRYGVEIGIVLDTWRRHGAGGIAQVELGVRTHRNRPTHELATMSRQIVGTLLRRLDIPDSGHGLIQFRSTGEGWLASSTELMLEDRPPLAELLVGDGALRPLSR